LSRDLQSRAFEDAGYYLLQWGRSDSADRVSVVFDCGELGFGTLAAHGHADALSVMVRAGGSDVLVDPGTYDYFSFPAWRQYFRSTRAHNTVAVDGKDQSDQLGSFLWGRRATARCLAWYPRDGGGKVVGEHDGYASLQDSVTCRRSLELDRETRSLSMTDEILSKGAHEVTLFFHFADHCEVRSASKGDHLFHVRFPGGSAILRLDPALAVTLSTGGSTPASGWMSRGYHRRTAASVVAATVQSRGALTLQTRIEFLQLGT
jgi:heparinase II/III-like protein